MSAAAAKTIETEFKSYTTKAQSLLKNAKTEAEQKKAVADLRTLQDKLSVKLLGLLSATQKARYRQIVLQSQGIWISVHPEISKALGLTSAQVAKIRAIRGEADKKVKKLETQRREQLSAIPQPKKDAPKAEIEAYRKKVTEKIKSFQAGDQKTLAGWSATAEKDALAVMTADQKRKWQQALGPAFRPKA